MSWIRLNRPLILLLALSLSTFVLLHQFHQISLPRLTNSQTVHVFFVALGEPALANFKVAVGSLLAFRSCPVHLHILAGDQERAHLSQTVFLSLLDSPNVYKGLPLYLSYLDPAHAEQACRYPRDQFYGGRARSKICLDVILPAHVEKVISIDTDTLIVDDILTLWQMADQPSQLQRLAANCTCLRPCSSNISETVATGTSSNMADPLCAITAARPPFGAVGQLSPWYRWNPHYLPCVAPETCLGVNSGVIVQDLTQLRRMNWTGLWTSRMAALEMDLALGDQDPLNYFFKLYPMVYDLPLAWNVQTVARYYNRDFNLSTFATKYAVDTVSILHGNGKTLDQVVEEPWRRAFAAVLEHPNAPPSCLVGTFREFLHMKLGMPVNSTRLAQTKACLHQFQSEHFTPLLKQIDDYEKTFPL